MITVTSAFVIVIILLVCVQWVSGETINIAYGTGNGEPEEEDLNYQLDCIISDLVSPVIAWSKDDNLLFWSAGTIIDLDSTGEYTIQEIGINPIHFILIIIQVRTYLSGNYKCFTAIGDIQNFSVVQMAVGHITVIPGSSLPEGLYFPSSEWPKCYPQFDVKALIYGEMTVRCVSSPGNPGVEVNIYNASNGQLVADTSLNETHSVIERTYTYEVIPTDYVDQFYCQIIGRNGMHRQCTMSNIEIGLFENDYIQHVQALQGTSVFFQCLAGSRNGIHWSTDPPIGSFRLEIIGDLLYIHDVEVTDNGTKVICRVDGYNLQDHALLIVTPHNTYTVGSTVESSSQATIPTVFLTLPPPTGTYSPSSTNGTAVPSNMIGLFVGVCIGLNVITFVTGIIVGVLCYCKKLQRDIKHEEDTTAKTRDSTVNSDQVNSRSNPKDSANLQNFNLTNQSDLSPRFAPKATQSNNESYTDLQLTNVHRSQYASLKKPDAVVSNRDYVNVNPQRDQEPVYEVHIESNI